ncbi:glycosyltransferase [Methylobacterium organophilum]|uniref:glycosyltransferase n=1 Tax=Methylobacterium organophilum TaxID=410 RepID=UPI001F1383BD|nr:glycosyltransferase [Methylobacterium organophilum]UMY19158.1 glycosyltransferase [Methylobacterium organophilum]
MLHGQSVTVVLPAYNASRTLRRTVEEIPRDIVDDIILIDDASADGTVSESWLSFTLACRVKLRAAG